MLCRYACSDRLGRFPCQLRRRVYDDAAVKMQPVVLCVRGSMNLGLALACGPRDLSSLLAGPETHAALEVIAVLTWIAVSPRMLDVRG